MEVDSAAATVLSARRSQRPRPHHRARDCLAAASLTAEVIPGSEQRRWHFPSCARAHRIEIYTLTFLLGDPRQSISSGGSFGAGAVAWSTLIELRGEAANGTGRGQALTCRA